MPETRASVTLSQVVLTSFNQLLHGLQYPIETWLGARKHFLFT